MNKLLDFFLKEDCFEASIAALMSAIVGICFLIFGSDNTCYIIGGVLLAFSFGASWCIRKEFITYKKKVDSEQ